MNNKCLRSVALVFPVVLALACEPVNSVEVQELEGTWVASEARLVEIAAPKKNNVDIIELGYEATFEADAAGSFVLVLVAPDGLTDVRSGTMMVDGKNLTLTTDRATGYGEVFLEGEQVAFRMTAGYTYDFSGHGNEVPVRLLLVMDRVSG